MAAWLALLILVVSGFILVGRHDAIVIGGMNAAELAMTASGLLLTVWLSGALLPQMRDTHPRAYRFILKGGSLALVVALTAWLHGPIQHGAHAAWTAWGREILTARHHGQYQSVDTNQPAGHLCSLRRTCRAHP